MEEIIISTLTKLGLGKYGIVENPNFYANKLTEFTGVEIPFSVLKKDSVRAVFYTELNNKTLYIECEHNNNIITNLKVYECNHGK